jgi:transcriptional regulator with XRE-family HTH domain
MADYARGERLRELRERTHESQETVAAEIGVSTKTLRAWEHGGKIRWENAKRLGRFYDADPGTLVSRELPELVADDGVPFQLDELARQVSEIHDALLGNESDAQAVAGIAARLLQAAGLLPKQADGPPQSPPAARQPPPA